MILMDGVHKSLEVDTPATMGNVGESIPVMRPLTSDAGGESRPKPRKSGEAK